MNQKTVNLIKVTALFLAGFVLNILYFPLALLLMGGDITDDSEFIFAIILQLIVIISSHFGWKNLTKIRSLFIGHVIGSLAVIAFYILIYFLFCAMRGY